MSAARPRLLLAGLTQPGTGFLTLIEALVREIGRVFDVHILGFTQSATQMHQTVVSGFPLTTATSSLRGFYVDPASLDALLGQTEPDLILVIGPGFAVTPLLMQLQAFRDRSPVALYMPIEGRPVDTELVRAFTLVDLGILYTQDARSGVKSLFDGNPGLLDATRMPRLECVPHGVDHLSFHPLAYPGVDVSLRGDIERRRMAREALAPLLQLSRGFVVLNVNRPWYRKRLDLTIEGFAKFASGRADVQLVLHTGQRSAKADAELRECMALSGGADKIMLSPGAADGKPMTRCELNLLYNAADVGVTTSMGEGWGLTTFEHAATRAAQLVPAHTCFLENWSDAARFIHIASIDRVFYEGTETYNVDTVQLAQSLSELYEDEKTRNELADAAYLRTFDGRFKWKSIGDKVSSQLMTLVRHRDE